MKNISSLSLAQLDWATAQALGLRVRINEGIVYRVANHPYNEDDYWQPTLDLGQCENLLKEPSDSIRPMAVVPHITPTSCGDKWGYIASGGSSVNGFSTAHARGSYEGRGMTMAEAICRAFVAKNFLVLKDKGIASLDPLGNIVIATPEGLV